MYRYCNKRLWAQLDSDSAKLEYANIHIHSTLVRFPLANQTHFYYFLLWVKETNNTRNSGGSRQIMSLFKWNETGWIRVTSQRIHVYVREFYSFSHNDNFYKEKRATSTIVGVKVMWFSQWVVYKGLMFSMGNDTNNLTP